MKKRGDSSINLFKKELEIADSMTNRKLNEMKSSDPLERLFFYCSIISRTNSNRLRSLPWLPILSHDERRK